MRTIKPATANTPPLPKFNLGDRVTIKFYGDDGRCGIITSTKTYTVVQVNKVTVDLAGPMGEIVRYDIRPHYEVGCKIIRVAKAPALPSFK